MRFFKFLICIVLYTGILPHLYAQDLPVIPSPQTWDFMAYGRVPVGLHTGQLDLEIPLYHYKDKDFDIPISLAYNSAGFVPSKPAGPVGLNWFLNCGGVITRRVVGHPDDMPHDEYIGYYPWPKGLFFRPEDTTNHRNVTTSDVLSFGPPISIGQYGDQPNVYCGIVNGPDLYDITPDIFEFNFLGYHGKFVCDVNGDIHVYDCVGAGTYEVDISEALWVDSYNPYISKIRIRTGDGYIYTFGGDQTNLEYSVPVNDSAEQPGFRHVFTSWYLSKIEAPNGRFVDFIYEFGSDESSQLRNGTYVINITPQEAKYHKKLIHNGNLVDESVGMIANSNNIQGLKASFIDQVKIDGKCIFDFVNTLKPKSDWHSLVQDVKTFRTDSINIYNSEGFRLKNIAFEYQYKGPPSYQRMFLESLTINGFERYAFNYINTNNLPSSTTKSIDFWGYWNNRQNSTIIPSFDLNLFNTKNDITYTSNERYPSQTEGVFNAGLLSSIHYPTGGYTLIKYEPHTYRARLERTSSSNFMPALLNTSGYAGGARVLKLEEVTNLGDTVNRRTFVYQSENNISSGILESWPILIQDYSIKTTDDIEVSSSIRSSGISINSTDERYVCYDKVEEWYGDDSHSEYNFTSYSDNPDDTSNQEKKDYFPYQIHPVVFFKNINHVPNSRAYQRGKLKNKTHYNSDGYPVEREVYIYKNIYNNQIAGINSMGHRLYHSYIIHADLYAPDTITKTIYDANGLNPIATTTAYSYNTHGLKSKESQTQSDNSVINTYTRYVSDLNNTPLMPEPTSSAANSVAIESDASAGFNKLISSMPGIPVEQAVYNKPANGNEAFMSASVTLFKSPSLKNDIALPYKQLILQVSGAVTDYHPIIKSGSDYYLDNRLNLEVTIEKYDSLGNILQHTGRDGIPVSYLWGYKGQYPVAKVIGANYTTVSSILGVHASVLAIDSPTIINIKPMIAHLKSGLTPAQVSGYSYIPLVGLSEEISPNGLMTYYKYDTFGRLRRILDHNNNLIQEYAYHYQGQPDDDYEILTINSWVKTGITRCETETNRITGYIEEQKKEYDANGQETGSQRWSRIPGSQNMASCPASYWHTSEDIYEGFIITPHRSYDDGQDPTYRILATFFNGVQMIVHSSPFSGGSFSITTADLPVTEYSHLRSYEVQVIF